MANIALKEVGELAEALRYSPAPFATIGPAGRISRGNGAFCSLIGLRHGQNFVGKSWYKLSPADRRGSEKLLLEQAAIGGNPVTYDKTIVLPDGELVETRAVAHPVGNGGFWFLLTRAGYGRHLSGGENIQCEAFIKAYDGMIYICDENNRIRYMNERLQRKQGRNAVGEYCHQVLHGLDEPCPWCTKGRVLAGETLRWVMHNEYDGRWYSIIDTPIVLQDGTKAKQSLFRDITPQKLMEQELTHALESQRVLFESLPVGVIAVDEHFCVTQMNPWAQAITGKGLGEVLGNRCSEVLGCGDDPLCPLRRSIAEGRPVGPDEWVVNGRNGGTTEVHLRASAIFDHQGNLNGGVETFQDISETKDMERGRARIISMLAHDMKNPLTSIRGFARRLMQRRDGLGPEKVAEYASFIESGAARLEGLVHKFLEMSRLQSGAVALDLKPVDLALELGRLMEGLRPQFESARVALTFSGPETASLSADPELLGRVFGNLLDNALQHSPPGGVVEVEIIRENGEVRVRVVDHGPGIDPDEIGLIFQPFFRGRAGKKRQGYGLGLAAAMTIARLHGGRLVVDSEPGKGAAFTLRLPAEQSSQ